MNLQVDMCITNALNLKADASAEMAANKINELDSKLDETMENLSVALKKCNDYAKKYSALLDEIEQLKASMDEGAEKQQLEKEATRMVNSFAKEGKIADDYATIRYWVDLAKESKDAIECVKNMLKTMPEPEQSMGNIDAKLLSYFEPVPNIKNSIHEQMQALARRHGQRV